MPDLKCPNCKGENISPEYYSQNGLVRNCNACHHEKPSSEFKRSLAVATTLETQLAHITLERDGLKRQLESATLINQKRERENIGLKQQIQDLKTAVAKLKAIRKELRNIIELQREA